MSSPALPGASKLVGDLVPGDRIEVYDATGVVTEVRNHGGAIGDGSVEWLTLSVRFDGELHRSAVGPKRATDRVPCDPQLPEKRLSRTV